MGNPIRDSRLSLTKHMKWNILPVIFSIIEDPAMLIYYEKEVSDRPPLAIL